MANDEPGLLEMLAEVGGLGEAPTWAIDLADGPAALVIAVLLGAGRDLVYIPGRMVNRAAGAYRGEGKTDARDAAVIADQARMRRDLYSPRLVDEITVGLALLTACRADLVADRTQAVNRLRALLTGIFPTL